MARAAKGPTTLIELQQRYSDEDTCWEALWRTRWLRVPPLPGTPERLDPHTQTRAVPGLLPGLGDRGDRAPSNPTHRRWLEHDLFFYVLRRSVQGEPLPYRRLTAEAAA